MKHLYHEPWAWESGRPPPMYLTLNKWSYLILRSLVQWDNRKSCTRSSEGRFLRFDKVKKNKETAIKEWRKIIWRQDQWMLKQYVGDEWRSSLLKVINNTCVGKSAYLKRKMIKTHVSVVILAVFVLIKRQEFAPRPNCKKITFLFFFFFFEYIRLIE